MKIRRFICGFLSAVMTGVTVFASLSGVNLTADAAEGAFRAFDLTETELQKIASLCCHEQPSHEGRAAEASLMANIYDLRGITSQSLYEYVRTCGWWANSKSYMDEMSASSEDIENIRKVLCQGMRTLPAYVNEHDYLGDIEVVTNNGTAIDKKNPDEYIRFVSQIKQLDSHFSGGGITYTYYCHPGSGSDPFGFTSEDNRNNYGDGHYEFGTWIFIEGEEPPIDEELGIPYQRPTGSPLIKKGSKG